MADRAQSPSSFDFTWIYHVFISFRGTDTRWGFAGNLYKALTIKGIHTFLDDEELRKGEKIMPTLHKAIQDSRMAIIVFSTNYAHSTFCLEELVEIFDCLKRRGRLVWPVFYDIDPSIVRHLQGSYGEAIAKHEERFRHDKEKVEKWKSTLREASDLSGWHFKQGCEYEYKFIERIVKEVSEKINRVPLHIANYPVGLESRVQMVISFFDNECNKESVSMLGIYGMPGIGKSTVARAVYNLIVDNFEGACFLFDVKLNASKYGLAHLQETLLSEIAGEKDLKLHDVNKGIPALKSRLQWKKLLIILDNVDKLEQLQAIVGKHDWFGSGSRILITTRDKHLLNVHGVEGQYELGVMNGKEALELLRWNAFKSDKVDPNYIGILNRVVGYCGGLPFALEKMGSSLFGKSVDEWNHALETFKRIPNNNVQEILRASYEALDENQKEIFLDIACFFKGRLWRDVTNILLKARGFEPEYTIRVLIEKSLIGIERNLLIMHDLIEDMGKEIIRQQSPTEPGKRSRLWFYQDILHVLEEDTGTDEIEGIVLHLPDDKEVQWSGKAFKKMKNLKILIIERGHFSRAPKYLPNSLGVLDWPGYPSSSLPSSFHSDKLGILNLSRSCIIQLDQPLKSFKSLNEINLSCCKYLERVPDVSGIPNLTKLNLRGCWRLIEVHGSVGFLGNLRLLNASECPKLKIFPNAIKSTYLEDLDLSGCSSLISFPKTFGIIENVARVCFMPSTLTLALRDQRMNQTIFCSSLMVPKIEELMKGFGCSSKWKGDQDQETVNSLVPSNLRALRCPDCSLVDEYLSTWVGFFPHIEDLDLSYSNLTDEYLVKGLPLFPNLEILNVSGTRITIIPECIKECRFLTTLHLDYCEELQEINGVPPNIETLSAEGCKSLSAQSASVLLSETLHKDGATLFTLPGRMIPEWFDHSCEGTSLSFWFRNKFPKIALCLVNTACLAVHKNFCLLINGMEKSVRVIKGNDRAPLIGHISLFDLQHNCVLGGEGGIEFITDAWNHVEVSLDVVEPGWTDGVEPYGIGICVYKQQSSAEDVRFTPPTPQKRTPRKYVRKQKQPQRGTY